MADIVVILPHSISSAGFGGPHPLPKQLGKQRFSRPSGPLPQQQSNSDQSRHWQRRGHVPRKPPSRAYGGGIASSLPMGLDPTEAAQSSENEAPSIMGSDFDNMVARSFQRDNSRKVMNTFRNRGRVAFSQSSQPGLITAFEVEIPEQLRTNARHRNVANPRVGSRPSIVEIGCGARVSSTTGAMLASNNALITKSGATPISNWFVELDLEDDMKSRKFHEDAEKAVAEVVEISLRSQLCGVVHIGAALQVVYQESAAALGNSSSKTILEST